MLRPNKRPLYSIVVLFCVSCAIFFVATGDTKSLGLALIFRPVMDVPVPDVPDLKQGAAQVKQQPAEEKLTKLETLPGLEAESLAESNQKDKIESIQQPENMGNGFTEVPFMPKMANETLKAKLGNSAWHLLHTVLARYPDKPTILEKNTMKLYIQLFAQVYPCGDCARHFQHILKKYPVQVELRITTALWGCHVHNKVNKRLEKPEYDCTKILEDYDCGCGSDEKEEDDTLGNDSSEHLRKVTVDEKEGKQRGG